MDMQGGHSPGALSSFKNVEPMSRADRNALRDKDTFEKKRIVERQARRDAQNEAYAKLPPMRNPIAPVKNSSLYIEENQRFARDVAGELARQKYEALHKKEEYIERKRNEDYYRDKQRWDRQEAAVNSTEARYQRARDTGTGAKSNQSSQAYNILTLEYSKTPLGQNLASKDQAMRERQQQRAYSLYSKANSVTHNIITGHQLQPMDASSYQSKPQPPTRIAPLAPWDK